MARKRRRKSKAEPEQHALSDFQRDPAPLVRGLQRSGAPVFLTVNGRPRLVLQAAEAYGRLLDRLEQAETLEGLRRGLEAFERGEGVQAFAALEAMLERHGLSRPR